MRSPGYDCVGLAWVKVYRFFRVLKVNLNVSVEDVKRVLNILMIVPGDNLAGRNLKFTDAKSVAFNMPLATFDGIKLARIGI